ncbi:MAG: acyl-CoA dehydrogenase [Bacteroidetes bacterium SW_11_45_7]|nr:MAG: acyl-CoA dehydrogenase [Bacteroidetes bacterium SW_11_45_7]
MSEDTKTQKKQVLKGGEYLVKGSFADDIFTPEDFTEEQHMIADMCHDFIKNHIDPNLDRIDNHEEGLVPGLIDQAGELGMLGMALPEKYGGSDQDFNTNSVMTEVMGGAHSFSVSLYAHIGIGTLPLFYYGTEEQKKNYLPKLATGEYKAAYCLTEPGSGSDALAAKTRADLSEDGEHYIINGQKMWITNGGFADLFTVFAQVDGEHFTAFLVDGNAEGIALNGEEDKIGIKGSSTQQIFFENVKVPKDNILGEIGNGHKIAFNILNIGRYKLCAATLGGAKRANTVSIQYANEREQFNQPISGFGAIKHKLAEQAIRIFACESATYRTSDYIDKMEKELVEEGKTAEEARMIAAEEYAIECALLKVYGSEVLDYVVDEAVQVHGGYGYSEEFPAARAYRDSRINRIFEGTNEINRMLSLDQLSKKAMSEKIDMVTPAKEVQKELTSVPDFSNGEDGFLADEKKIIKNIRKSILMAVGAATRDLGKKMKEEQELLLNLADMMIELYAVESALLRTEKIYNNKGKEEAQPYVDMTRVYLNDALDRIYVSGKNAVTSFAEGDNLRMMLTGIKRFTKASPVNTKDLRRKIADRLIEANEYCF